ATAESLVLPSAKIPERAMGQGTASVVDCGASSQYVELSDDIVFPPENSANTLIDTVYLVRPNNIPLPNLLEQIIKCT
ncbi:hypothetical protein BGW41_007171, partial [Actinomortierella wolfii]